MTTPQSPDRNAAADVLAPCPFCRSTFSLFRQTRKVPDTWVVRCEVCGAQCGPSNSSVHARENWNLRTPERLAALRAGGEPVAWGAWAEGDPTRLLRYDGQPAVSHTRTDFYNVALYPSPAAAQPERAGGGEVGITCSRCKGSGEGTVQIGVGPDAYDAPVMCEACGGSGAFDPAEPLRPFPTMLRKMWSGGDVQRWIDENIAPAYAAMCKLAALNAPPAVAPEGEQQRDVLIECIAAAAVRAGIIRPDALVDGPTAMMLANDLATAALNAPPAADGMVVAVVREVCAEMKAELVANQGIRPNQVRGWHMRLSAAAPRQDGAEGVGK